MQKLAQIESPDNSATPTGATACCGIVKAIYVVPVLAGLIAAIGAAAYFAGKASISQPVAKVDQAEPQFSFPPIDAAAAVTSEKYSMATGPVGDGSEGLFVLDHNSGLLQCTVIYPRKAHIGARYQINVADALASGGKGGSYIMCTGTVAFQSNNQNPVAPVVVYVMDTSSGNYVAYYVPFNRALVNNNRTQSGKLVQLFVGTANPIADRDPGR